MFIRGRQLIEWIRKELAFEPVQRTSSKRLLKLQGVLKRCDYNLISQDDCVTASLCVHASDQGPVVLSDLTLTLGYLNPAENNRGYRV